LPVRCHVGRITVCPGDRLLLYTNDLVDRTDTDGRPFGEDGIEALTRRHPHLNAREFCDLAGSEATRSERWTMRDDILLMYIRIPAAEHSP